MNVRCLKISFTNAMFSECFPNSKCYTEPQGIHFVDGAIFRNGLDALQRVVENPDTIREFDMATKSALECLVQFFMDGEPSVNIYRASKYGSKLEWTVVVAQHILSKLAGQKCLIDHHYQNKDVLIADGGIDYTCPCDKHEHMLGKFGDTSFWYENGWHGSVDILIGNAPVWLKTSASMEEDNDRLSTISDGSDSSEEIEQSTFIEEDKMLLRPMCIVNSFLQRKCDETLNNYIIPTLGMSRRKLVVVFYDCVKDILVTTAELDL